MFTNAIHLLDVKLQLRWSAYPDNHSGVIENQLQLKGAHANPLNLLCTEKFFSKKVLALLVKQFLIALSLLQVVSLGPCPNYIVYLLTMSLSADKIHL